MYKTIRIIMAAFWLLAAMSVSAQDQRQRKPETIVQDVLAQMPTQNHDDFEREIGDLAKSEEDLLSYIAFPQVAEKFLKAREERAKNTVKYTIVALD